MRAAQGGPHEAGGRHISGAERLVALDKINSVTAAMVERAQNHSRGTADFINITVETVAEEQVVRVPLLPPSTIKAKNVAAGRAAAAAALQRAGVTPAAITSSFEQLLALPDSMRGAMLLCAETGRRLDDRGQRGVRVSRMDIADAATFSDMLTAQCMANTHAWEAMVLAAKVLAGSGVVAELCWSDDPEYVTGYVAVKSGYQRIKWLFKFSQYSVYYPLGIP
jgi:6-carboxyhexanoate--CoA ligase